MLFIYLRAIENIISLINIIIINNNHGRARVYTDINHAQRCFSRNKLKSVPATEGVGGGGLMNLINTEFGDAINSMRAPKTVCFRILRQLRPMLFMSVLFRFIANFNVARHVRAHSKSSQST